MQGDEAPKRVAPSLINGRVVPPSPSVSATDAVFCTEITNKIGDINRLPGFEPEDETANNDTKYDDTSLSVPLSEVIQDVTGKSVNGLAGEDISDVNASTVMSPVAA